MRCLIESESQIQFTAAEKAATSNNLSKRHANALPRNRTVHTMNSGTAKTNPGQKLVSSSTFPYPTTAIVLLLGGHAEQKTHRRSHWFKKPSIRPLLVTRTGFCPVPWPACKETGNCQVLPMHFFGGGALIVNCSQVFIFNQHMVYVQPPARQQGVILPPILTCTIKQVDDH
jgi:hypothetical protein